MSGPPSRSSTPTTSPASNDLSDEPIRGGRARRPLPHGLLLLAIGAAVAVLVVYLLIVRTRWGQTLDTRALLGRDVISALREDQASRFLSIISAGTLTLATALVAAVAFLRGRPRLAIIAAASIGVAVLSTELLKLVVLERPPFVVSTISGGDNSYPSGHTTIGMSVCIAALLVVPPRLRIGTALAAGAIGAAFGIAVVAAGWHRPSDAIGAYLVCLAVGAAAAILIRRWSDPVREKPGWKLVRGSVRLGATELGLLALAVALVGVFGLAALAARGIPFFSAGTGFLVASAALALASFLSTGLLALAMSSPEGEPHG